MSRSSAPSRTSAAAALHRHRQPLVRVERERVGALQPGVGGATAGSSDADRAVGAVDVEPQALGRAEVGQLGRAGRWRRCRPCRRWRRRRTGGARRAVRGDGARAAPPRPFGSRRRRGRSAPRPRRGRAARPPCGGSCGPPRTVEDEGRLAREPVARGRPSRPRRAARWRAAARHGERGHRAAADQQPHAALGREADQLHQPADGGALQVDGGVVAAGAARIQGRRQQLGEHARSGAGGEFTQPKKRGWPLPIGWGEDLAPARGRAALSGARPGPAASAPASAARSAGVIGWKTGRSRMPSRWSATRSTARVAEAAERLGVDGRRRTGRWDSLRRLGHERPPRADRRHPASPGVRAALRRASMAR